MLNVSSRKVVIPAALFALLSPGVLLQLPDNLKLGTGQTSRRSVIVHAIVFAILYRLIAAQQGMVLQPADLVVPTVLFVLLSPGMLLSLPSTNIASGRTNTMSVLIHTLVFILVFAFLRKQFPQYY